MPVRALPLVRRSRRSVRLLGRASVPLHARDSCKANGAKLDGVIEVGVPQYHELMFAVLDAVKALGGSATNDEMQKAVVEALALTEQQQQAMHSGVVRA